MKVRSVFAVVILVVPVSWFKPATASCTTQDPGLGLPVGMPSSCAELRPGSRIEILDQAGCTAAFQFRGSDGARYVSTAGHCVLVPLDEWGGEFSWEPGVGPVVSSPGIGRIGRFVYAREENQGYRDFDFALIRLDPGVPADPQMMHWGGPTGLYEDYPANGSGVIVLRHYGVGVGFEDTIPARTAVAHGAPDPEWLAYWGVGTLGDSGSPIITDDGRAVAIHNSGGGGVDPFTGNAGNSFATRVAAAIERAGEVLDITFELLTAPLLR